jgi:hypothetical protein
VAATYRASGAGGATSGSGNRTVTVTTAISGDLLVVVVGLSGNSSSTVTLSDDHADGLGTYHRVGNALWNGSANNGVVFVRDALLGSTDTSFVITCTSGSNTAGEIVWAAFAGMTRAGSAAVRSSGSQANQGAATTPAPALNQSALTGNPTLAAVISGDTTTTQPTGWTERQDVSQSTPTTAVQVSTRDSGFTGTTITFGASCSTVFASWAIELDSSAPLYTAAAAVTHAALTGGGSATFAVPVYTGSAAVTHAALTASASGWTSGPHPVGVLTQFREGIHGRRYVSFAGKIVTPPFSVGDAAVTHGALTVGASGWTSAPHPVGVLTQFRAGLYGRRYGAFDARGGSAAAAALTLGAKTAAGSATFAVPVYAGGAAVSLGALAAGATGTTVAPVYDGTGAATHAALTAAGSATFAAPVYTAAGAVTHGALTAGGSALFAAAIYVGSAAVTLGAQAAAGAATFAVPVYTASAALTHAPLSCEGAEGEDAPDTGAVSADASAPPRVAATARCAPRVSATARITPRVAATAELWRN